MLAKGFLTTALALTLALLLATAGCFRAPAAPPARVDDATLDAMVAVALTEAAPTPTDPIDDVRATLDAMMAAPTATMPPPPPTPTDPADALQATLVAFIAAPTHTPIPTATPRPTPRPTYTPRPTATPTRAPRPTPTPTVADLVARLKPSIARIVTTSGNGSGFVYDARGLVATNAHVVDCCRDVAVILNGRRYEGRVLGRNDAADLAVVQVNAGSNFPSMSFGQANRVAVGDDVIALGFPLDLGDSISVTRGIVSSHRSYDGYKFIQTDAAINFGNSGGPLINQRGEVVGMNSFIIRGADGVGFALSVAEIEHRLPGLSSYAAAAPTPRPLPTATPRPRPTATPRPRPTATPWWPTATPRPTLAQATAITNNSSKDLYPSWSPDGRRIVFNSDRDGDHDIYVMNADGSDVVQLTHNSADDVDPEWSPDGRWITFHSDRDGDFDIYVMGTDGSDVTQLTHNSAADHDPEWSPDSRQIVFISKRDGDFEIYVMNADGSAVTQLTHDSAEDYRPKWSPDGRRIAFVRERDDDYDIYVMNADGSDVTQITYISAKNGHPAWSPDGRRIVFVSERGDIYDIYLMNADGSAVTQLTRNAGSGFGMSWSRDGRWIAFYAYWDGDGEIYVIAAPP